jgi:Chaperone of endosialidase
MTSDHAQSNRIAQRGTAINQSVRMVDSSEMPEVAYKGQIIYLTDLDCLSIYDGLAWQNVGDQTFSVTYVGPTDPSPVNEGDHWLNTTNGQLLTWDGSAWVDAIGADQVTNIEIAADTITATEIMAGTITADEIAAGAISAGHIQADAIDVTKLRADAITSKHTITGATIRTSAGGNRIVLHNDGSGGVLQGYTDSGEASPSQLNPGFSGGRPTMQLRAGSMTGTPGGTLVLYGDSGSTTREATFNCDVNIAGDLSANTLWATAPPGDGGTLPHAVWGASGQLKKQTSSARYKEDIEPLEMDVHTLLKLTPKQFKDKVSGAKSVGFIAEEAADLGLERWVYRRPEDRKPESFGYSEWTAALQKICQAQQRQIDELMHRVATLERMAGGHS